ncbi:MAG: ABC transporter ATP-binding protein [Alphaproteobacteria bacterium]|nr:ABC transporter ATP-binding protein [Alphaproteobacteria bacterium]
MTEPLLEARDVFAGYVADLAIVRGASIAIASGEVVTIIGPNGAGKSTFVKTMAGLVRLFSGAITLAGRAIGGLPPQDLVRAGLGFVPQTANVFTTLTVHENLRVGGHLLRHGFAARAAAIYSLFPDLADRRRHLGSQLSGGQRQMLAFARALIMEPRVLMLDEPSAGLSPKMANMVFEKARSLARTGIAVLMVEQNAKAALAVSDRAYVLVEGREQLSGPADRLLDDPAVRRLYLGGHA